MATIKIYVDTVTQELVILNGTEYRYPAYSEIQRQKLGDFLTVKTVGGVELLHRTEFSQLLDESGVAYASFADLKAALDSYFDATI